MFKASGLCQDSLTSCRQRSHESTCSRATVMVVQLWASSMAVTGVPYAVNARLPLSIHPAGLLPVTAVEVLLLNDCMPGAMTWTARWPPAAVGLDRQGASAGSRSPDAGSGEGSMAALGGPGCLACLAQRRWA
jgi:hypothetical protein